MGGGVNKLTAVSLKTRKPGLHADGGGLYLQVTEGHTGEPRRSWLCRVTIQGKRRELGLGTARDITLAQARAKCATWRRLAAIGVDPKAHEAAEFQAKAAKAAKDRARSLTFRAAAGAYVDAHAPSWKSGKHARQWAATLEAYVYPIMGDVSVGEVDREMVLKVLDPIWASRTETAARVRGRIESVLDWAMVRGLREGENPARWRGALSKVLPARSKIQRPQHHPAMPYREAPAFMHGLLATQSPAASCLAFLILTASRYNEAAGATWAEMDFVNACWTLPAARMKGSRAHRVALSGPALEILRGRVPAGNAAGDYVFASHLRKGCKLSDMTLTAILRRAGLPYTVHGFRSTFRIWAAEQTSFPREVCEAALAHVNADRVEAAYMRSDLFEKRRDLMQAWGTHLSPIGAA